MLTSSEKTNRIKIVGMPAPLRGRGGEGRALKYISVYIHITFPTFTSSISNGLTIIVVLRFISALIKQKSLLYKQTLFPHPPLPLIHGVSSFGSASPLAPSVWMWSCPQAGVLLLSRTCSYCLVDIFVPWINVGVWQRVKAKKCVVACRFLPDPRR